jgi:hypothetical protein
MLLISGVSFLAPVLSTSELLGLILIVVSLNVHQFAAIFELQAFSKAMNKNAIDFEKDLARLSLHQNRSVSFLNQVILSSKDAEKLAEQSDEEFFEEFAELIEEYKENTGEHPFYGPIK